MPFFRQARDAIMKKKKKMLFIYNPRAGKAQIRSNLLDIIDIFTKADFEVTAHPTQARGDGMCAVRERRPGYYDLIACCGGPSFNSTFLPVIFLKPPTEVEFVIIPYINSPSTVSSSLSTFIR